MNKNKVRKALSLLIVLSLLISLLTGVATASTTAEALGNVTNVVVEGSKLVLTVDNGFEPSDDLLTIEVCQDNILRVDYQPNSIEESPNTPLIDPNLTWDGADASIDATGDPITVATADMQIEIARTPCRMTVKKADGTVLFWEPASGGIFNDGIRFVRASSSNMYGIHSFDCFSENGSLLRNNNGNTASAGQQGNSGGPFMWSTAGYGILVDSDGGYPYTNSQDKKMEFYYGGTPTEGRRYVKDDVEYYIILGAPKDIMKGFSKITGTSPMMPKWSMGFSNFEWNINEAELDKMVDLYRAKNIPIDGYAFDYDWKRYGDDNYGEFTWNTDNFPSAATTALKNKMDAKGIKMIGITKPRIVTRLQNGTTTIQGNDAAVNNYFYPGHNEYTDYFLPVTVRSIDPYKAEERAWWWEHSEDAFNKGIVGWWNDETDKVSSNGADYWFGNFTTLGISQAMYEGQRNYTNDGTRVWQTARNYYPGTQRYATSIWSGDVATQFYKGERVDWAAGLNEQKATLLSTINNGQVKWGTDGGGFNQNSGNIENPSPELYTRWLQLASVTPVFRVHGTNYQQRQPWYFGTTAEEAVKATIHQRYSLIPYIYSYEREAYDSGLGLVRPLLFDFPDDPNVADYSDAWMFGDWLLVAPITEREQSVKWIYLPEGTWVDYNRGTQYTGGKYIPYSINSESWTDLPMFVKAGAIIPTQDVQDYVGQTAVNEVRVDLFPSAQTTRFRYYDDDGQTYQYENGNYFSQVISTNKAGNGASVNIAGKSGSYSCGLEYYYLAVHGQAAAAVTENGSGLTKYDDYNALLAAPAEGWTVGRDVYGDVTYIKAFAGSGQAKSIALSGSTPVQADTQKYEAEYASLSGATVATKAGTNNNHSGYSGIGFVDKLESDEASVTFYAKVANAGTYNIGLRYANGDTSTKTLSVYVNGSYAGQAALTASDSWDTWGDAMIELPLVAGNNAITLKHDTATGDTGFANIDYITVPFYPSAITVEAESAALYGSAATNKDHWFYSGSGFVDGFSSAGAAAEFSVEVPQAGQYAATVRFCNGTQADRTLNLYVNGNYVSTLTFPSVGGNWNEWKELTKAVSLPAGKSVIALRYDSGNSGNVNLDKLTVNISGDSNIAPLIDNGGFERPVSFSTAWTEWHPDGQALAYGVDSGSGSNPPESPIEGDKRAYFYLGGAYQQSIHQGINVPNGTYQIQAWVKVSNATPTIGRMEITNYGGNDIYIDMPASGSGWTLITAENVAVSSGYLDIGFYCSSPGGTTVHIDSVKAVSLK